MKKYVKLVSIIGSTVPLLAGCFGGYNEYQHDKLLDITEADEFATTRASKNIDSLGAYGFSVDYNTAENTVTITPDIDYYDGMSFNFLDSENSGNGAASTEFVEHWESYVDQKIAAYIELQTLFEGSGAENFGFIIEDARKNRDEPLLVIAEDEVQWQQYRQETVWSFLMQEI